MDYATLTAHIEDVTENTFTAAQLALFVKQAEQEIYNVVQFPALRKNCRGTTTSGNEYITVPTDFLYPYSVALVDGSSDYNYLHSVDETFIREAYPNRTTLGQPKYYGHFDADSLIIGPTPDDTYTIELHYGYYPESIVTASTTWLGNTFDNALLNRSLVEAIRFLKGEEDLVAMYTKLYMESVALLKTLGDGKLRQDAYRSGQARVKVG